MSVPHGMCHNMLKLNDSKTELLIIVSRQELVKINVNSVQVGTFEIVLASSVRSLGAWFDKNTWVHAHTGKVCSKAFFGLNKIRQIRKFILDDATKTLVHAFVTSHVDYCNSLLYGLSQYQLNRLQRALNAVARVTCHLSKYSHITPALLQLHWLLVASRIRFKIVLLVYKALKGSSPSYTTELRHIKPPSRHALRNDDQHLLLVQRTKWKSLPLAIRNSANVDSFSKWIWKLFYLGKHMNIFNRFWIFSSDLYKQARLFYFYLNYMIFLKRIRILL